MSLRLIRAKAYLTDCDLVLHPVREMKVSVIINQCCHPADAANTRNIKDDTKNRTWGSSFWLKKGILFSSICHGGLTRRLFILHWWDRVTQQELEWCHNKVRCHQTVNKHNVYIRFRFMKEKMKNKLFNATSKNHLQNAVFHFSFVSRLQLNNEFVV